jgi:hypothetical protein
MDRTERDHAMTNQTTETAALSPWLACVMCGAVLHAVRPGRDTCKRCRRRTRRGARADEQEWLSHYVTHSLGTGQVVALAPQAGCVWVCDDRQMLHNCQTADLVRLDDHQNVQEALW